MNHFDITGTDIISEEASDRTLKELLLKELNMSYQRFGWIFIDKFIWNYAAWNEYDELGMAKQLCKSMVSMILSDPVEIWTPSDTINKKIETELFGRMHFNSVLNEQLTHCMITGDMCMSLDRDIYDNQLTVKYTQGNNLFALAFNNHTVHKIAYCSKEYLCKESYIIVTIEDAYSRTKLLYRFSGTTLTAIDFGAPEWIQIMGQEPIRVEFNDPQPYKRFAWIHTARQDSKWKDTPYHNSMLYPWVQFERLHKDWKNFNKELDLKQVAVLADPTLFEDTNQERERMGIAPLQSEPEIGGLYRMLYVGKEQFKVFDPAIRFNEWYAKLKFDLQMICLSRGLNASVLQLEQPSKEMTATESVLSNKQTQNTIKDIEANLAIGIQTIVWALINEWWKEGTISDDDFLSVDSIGSIDVKFSDGFYRNREQTVNMMLNVYNAASIDGSKLITRETFLKEGLGYSKEHAEIEAIKAQEEFSQAQLRLAETQANQQIVQAQVLTQSGLVQQQQEEQQQEESEEQE